MSESGQKVAVIGAGVAGLSAAYDLLKSGADVTLYEKEAALGGLASSFALDDGYLERYYHFICKNDTAYFDLLHELGLMDRLKWRLTKMAQFYRGRLYSFGDPWDLLFFSPLSWIDRLRFGLNIMAIKGQPADAWRAIEDQTVEEWMVQRFGRETYEALHKPLIDLKFGPYGSQLSAAWMWARIHRLGKSRTPVLQMERLGYLVGGTQVLVDALAERIAALGGKTITGQAVDRITLDAGRVQSVSCAGQTEDFDMALSTIPTPCLVKLVAGPGSELVAGLNNIDSIGVTCLVLRLDHRFSRYFWTNISDERIAVAGIIEYSNLNAGACNNGDRIIYIPQYLPSTIPAYQKADQEILDEYLEYLRVMKPDFDRAAIRDWWVFRDQYAQPICTTGFSRHVAGIDSPVAGLYITDSHQLYPDDRTVSNSIALGHRAADLILSRGNNGRA
jgi:protoporphyrinogen oxidase